MGRQALTWIRETLRRRVCSVCTDRNVDWSCGLPPPRICPLDRHLPEIVDAVGRVVSDRIEDYVPAIRESVCSICDGQDEDGICRFREGNDCALDAYIVLIVEAIEGARRRKRERRANFAG
ncbi:MAG: hypothetical protein ACE5F1_17085 [Planctomycetota bacterium]